MKKTYQSVEVEVIQFDKEDVITTSGGIDLPDETLS